MRPAMEDAAPPTIRTLLATNRAYRHLWLAQFVSLVGDFFNITALMTLVSAESAAGHEGRQVACLLIANSVPAVVVGPFAGVIVDRFDRRHLMIVCDLVRAALALLFCFTTTTSSLFALYAIVVVMMVFSTFFDPRARRCCPTSCPVRS